MIDQEKIIKDIMNSFLDTLVEKQDRGLEVLVVKEEVESYITLEKDIMVQEMFQKILETITGHLDEYMKNPVLKKENFPQKAVMIRMVIQIMNLHQIWNPFLQKGIHLQ